MNYALIVIIFIVLSALLTRVLLGKAKKLIKFAVHMALGYVFLFVLNFFGSSVGLHIDFTVLNIIIAGVGGLPGVFVLVVLNFLGLL